MSAAWYEEVDIGLLAEIQRNVRVYKGEDIVSLEDNQLSVRKPEEDYKIETYPSVSIYNLSTKFDYIRHVPDGKVNVTKDLVNATMTYSKKPVPFNLEYQIDFWSKYQTDMNMMLKTWMTGHYRQFNLPIKDNDLTTSCNAVQISDIQKVDELESDLRIFHSLIKYSIWVDLEDSTLYNGHIVKSRELDLSLKTPKDDD